MGWSLRGRTFSGMDSHHSLGLFNSGSTSKITPRNGNRRCFTTCPIGNRACLLTLFIAYRLSFDAHRAITEREHRRDIFPVQGGPPRTGAHRFRHRDVEPVPHPAVVPPADIHRSRQMLQMGTDKVRLVVVKARAFDSTEEPDEEDLGGNPIDEGFRPVLEAQPDDATPEIGSAARR